MLARCRSVFTYANVVSSLALFVVLGGGAYAASSFIGSNRQIRGCVTREGRLTVLKPGTHCRKGTSQIAWTVQGPHARESNGHRGADVPGSRDGFWRLDGNGGTNPPTNFLGTIDDK